MREIHYSDGSSISWPIAELAGRLSETIPKIGTEHAASVAAALKSFPHPDAKRLWDYCFGVDAETERLWSDAAPRPIETLDCLTGQDRREYPIVADQAPAVRLAVEMLAAHPDVYHRGGTLVEISGSRVLPVEPARLGTLLSAVAAVTKGGKRAVPPGWLVSGMLAEPAYSRIPELVGVITAPTVRQDGSVVSRPGYDPATRLWYAPDRQYDVPDSPDHDDARWAAEELFELVQDFPFVSGEDVAAFLAALLTPLARPAIRGPVPLYLVTANAPGIGKSLLIDLISILATGEAAPRSTFPDSDAELGKVLTSILIEGQRLVLFDNISPTTTFGGPNLEAALTGRTWRGRILGLSKTAEVPIEASWNATGNNLRVSGDTVRRCYVTRLHTALEHPEERSGFRVIDILTYVREERPRLVRAALTILRAHALAGRPGDLKPFGSFEAWSRVIRSAVVWAFGFDPLGGRESLRAEDPETESRLSLLIAWKSLGESTVADAIVKIRSGEAPALAEALAGRVDAREIGKRLSAIRGRKTNGLVLSSRPNRNKVMLWRVDG